MAKKEGRSFDLPFFTILMGAMVSSLPVVNRLKPAWGGDGDTSVAIKIVTSLRLEFHGRVGAVNQNVNGQSERSAVNGIG